MALHRESPSSKFPLGSKLPSFELPNVDGRNIGSQYFSGAKAVLVVFTCNHCPYVKGSEEMLIKIVKEFESQGLKTITISSNDAAKYPEDSFEKMKEKAKNMSLPFPYLYDENQSVARSFDAACTPECFLFDAEMKLVYHGTINDNPKDKTNVAKDFLSPAIREVLNGKAPDPQYVHPIGCSIKWR